MYSGHSLNNYTDIKNSRFKNNTGSSFFETILLTQIPTIFNYIAILLVYSFRITINYSYQIFIIEFLSTIFMCVISLTVFSNYIVYVYLLCCFCIIPILLITYYTRDVKRNLNHLLNEFITENKLPCITYFRGIVNIYSVICILASDFTCFPERFLKTESYGFGLMDTGVGLFIVTYSFSSSHLRSRSSTSVIRKVLPLLLVGVGRLVSTSIVNYHHQVSEYGTQWNFFITLSLLICINEIIFKFVYSIRTVFIMTIALLFAHECILVAGLQDWITSDAPRTAFISSNREGIFSLLGYEVIYLFGVVIKSTLPKIGDVYRKYIENLCLYSRNLITSILMTVLTEKWFRVSRRTANIGYIFWILSITYVGIIAAILLELSVKCAFYHSKNAASIEVIPRIVKSVNFNGFIFFLAGNVLTGLINLSIPTLKLSTFYSVIIISLYMLCCCSLSMFLYNKQIRLR